MDRPPRQPATASHALGTRVCPQGRLGQDWRGARAGGRSPYHTAAGQGHLSADLWPGTVSARATRAPVIILWHPNQVPPEPAETADTKLPFHRRRNSLPTTASALRGCSWVSRQKSPQQEGCCLLSEVHTLAQHPPKEKEKHWRPHGCQLPTQLEQQQVRKRCYNVYRARCSNPQRPAQRICPDGLQARRGHIKSGFARHRCADKTFLLWVLDILVQNPKESSQRHPSGAGAALEESGFYL